MANSTSNTTALLTEDVQRILIQPLQAQSKFLSSGPTIVQSAGPVVFPKSQVDDGTGLVFTAENAPIPETTKSFDEINLLPSTMQSVKIITRFSNELARQSVLALDATLQNRLVTDVANKVDSQLFGLGGDGVTTPKGIQALAGATVDNSTSTISFDSLLDCWGTALQNNVSVETTKWVIQPKDVVALRKLKDSSNRYLLQPDSTQQTAGTLFGLPVVVTPRFVDTTDATPKGQLALVDFSQVVYVQDLAPSITVLKERYADYDQSALRVVTRFDLGIFNSKAVTLLKFKR